VVAQAGRCPAFMAIALLTAACLIIPRTPDSIERDFGRLADQVVQAVRNRNGELLLLLSRPDLPDAERTDMTSRGPLYCYIFDSSCAENGRSVFDLVTTARHLVTKVHVSTPWSRDQRFGVEDDRLVPRRASLMLFDAAVVDEEKVTDTKYFCARWGREIAVWTFEYVHERWRSASTIFDTGTDAGCPVRG
jgi:hypothetical protein